ncbi:MAG TPA: SHOCT domain-containing protein [Gemmatimonadaceae bacterium]
MMLFWLVVMIVLVAVVWSVAQRGGFGPGGAPREDRAETLLRERYARGEIDEATYRRMLDELRRP